MNKKNKHTITFYKHHFDIFIDIMFVLIAICLFFVICIALKYFMKLVPNLQDVLGDIISSTVTVLIFIIGLFTKVRNKILHLINIAKHKIYSFLNTHKIYLLSKTVTQFNIHSYPKTQGQAIAINKALNILRSNRQGIISIESTPGKGKTTTALMLMDVIGNDIDLLDTFVRVNKRFFYFDVANDSADLFNFFNKQGNLKNSVVVVDNLHKLSLSKLDELLATINNNISYFEETEQCFLIILMYQNHKYTRKISEYIESFNINRNSNEYITLQENFLDLQSQYNELSDYRKNYIQKINSLDNEILKKHLSKIIKTKSAFCNLLLCWIFDKKDINLFNKKESDILQMLSEIILISSYYGYVTKDSLYALWKIYSNNKIKAVYLIKELEKCQFLIEFPFTKNAFLLNESLSYEYKKIFIHIPKFLTLYQSNAVALFNSQDSNPIKWLYLISTDAAFYKDLNKRSLERLFNECLSILNVNYILDILEKELQLYPDKSVDFAREIGMLYIRNGEWKKAREQLLPYIKKPSTNIDECELYLQVIEADHGIDDAENLKTLELIKNNISDEYIIFKADYWTAHIKMEQGNFSLKPWSSLNLRWQKLEGSGYKDDVINYRILSDYARVYFLSGISKYSEIKNIFEMIAKEKNQNKKKEAEYYLITRAHYLHYEIIYELGIWGWRTDSSDENMYIKSLIEMQNPLDEFIKVALKAYNIAINKYQELGDKKLHTAKVRYEDLKLCYSNCNYVNIIDEFQNFLLYAKSNNALVFEGYAETLLGKAFILYADDEMLNGRFDKADSLFQQASSELNKALYNYNNYGNIYGCLRAEFLLLLLSLIQEKSSEDVLDSISDLEEKYDIAHKYMREFKLLEHLKNNVSKIRICRTILRFYPIILQ